MIEELKSIGKGQCWFDMAGQLLLQAFDTILGSNPQKLANGVHISSSQNELACVGKFNQCIQNLCWSFKSLWFFHWKKEGNNYHLIKNTYWYFPIQLFSKKYTFSLARSGSAQKSKISLFRLKIPSTITLQKYLIGLQNSCLIDLEFFTKFDNRQKGIFIKIE